MELASRPSRPTSGWRSALMVGAVLIAVLAWRSPAQLAIFGSALIVAAGSGFAAVPLLRRWKARQFIREDGPQSHLKKVGTPTMGGIFFMPWALAVPLLFAGFDADLLAAVSLAGSYGLVGWLDDYQIIRQRSNKGITPRQKMALLIGAGLLFCLYAIVTGHSTAIRGLAELGWLFWPLALVALTGTANAVNITDGLDGLAGGTAAVAAVALGLIVLPAHPALAALCFALAGACLGFLVHNRHKARVFMGDTGALAIGGVLAAVAVLSGQLLALALVGGIFVIEAFSVIAQVSYYKATKGPDGKGKRLLRMAPLHHHLELGGLHETQVVNRFYLAAGLLALFACWMHSAWLRS
ncbi:phospho-N-acetylmuramoyl-pentapeptide-transferase [Gloeobacter kilaueensis]|uniref:Phospho-N-acetylmuramoyl-pentapeptide-transferase n=1 Tax=Gloeobacter kilaueensis (strain ATCC BAA-2537 / CCAP 1431/1 / ULC 316 / JS1) TaxID=1183438 RepID=U5QJL8_GLOK1|nr:phospho-N-acetylmuramoyl-pentapeptide-transferase [Gloeobacter kilaueensis]AGY59083.1 phospho-N-acetylmuramoyl-pentapeptide-transferase [Gloeobacter kilaueensis JS1]